MRFPEKNKPYKPGPWIALSLLLLLCAGWAGPAAARRGTIDTRQELPADYFAAEFIPERPSLKSQFQRFEDVIVIVGLSILGLIPAIVNWKRTCRFFLVLTGAALVLSMFTFLIDNRRVTPVFLALAGVYLAIGLYKYWRQRAAATA
ncbi:MAG: hypothetical protein JXA37_01995 [Chloroflexia bacterium]|nr:hypothetical protein [Chloroflexia bacterium]